MAESVATLVAEVKQVVDVTDDQALTALNRRHRRMVAVGRSRRSRVEIGPTVAGQAFYPVTGVVEALGVFIDGVPQGKARREDVYAYQRGGLVWSTPGGLIVTDASSAGVAGLSFIPGPTDAGLSIELYAALLPADLLLGDPISAVKVDPDFYDALVEGAASTWLRREGEGDPNGSDARFDAECERLRQRVNARFRGSGPSQIRVLGINA